MWFLPELPKKTKICFSDFFREEIKKRVKEIDIDILSDYLCDEKIEFILTASPNELYSKIEEFKCNLFFDNDYDLWLEAATKRKPGKEQKELVEKYKFIEYIFDYDKLISKNKKNSYEIAKMIGINACVYCNRQYIFTVIKDELEALSEEKKITRPEFDHYLPKYKYPFLALSLHNLIPSCHICNSNCKGTKELGLSMNPYSNWDPNRHVPQKDYFEFSYEFDTEGAPKVTIDRSKMTEEAKAFLQCFEIEEIYNHHSPLELKDLFTFAAKYSKTYLEKQGIQTGGFTLSQEEAYRTLFGTELDTVKNNERPLSKFKRDILRKLKIIR